MSTSNTTPLDQRLDPSVNAELREERKKTIQSSLARRHRKEKTFRMLGFSAVLVGLFFVVLLFGSILAKGLPAFWQSSMSLPIHFDPAIVNIGPPKTASWKTSVMNWVIYIPVQKPIVCVTWC